MRVALDSRYQSRKRIWKKFAITAPMMAYLEHITDRDIYAKLYKIVTAQTQVEPYSLFFSKVSYPIPVCRLVNFMGAPVFLSGCLFLAGL